MILIPFAFAGAMVVGEGQLSAAGYELSLIHISEHCEGGLILSDAAGQQLGQVAPPWAVDAAGNDVATHFEVDGTIVTQIVEHNVPGVTYPVVADPWIAAAALIAAAWCAKGALASVPASALSDLIDGKPSSWKNYATNAVIGCPVGEVGSWVWKFLPGKAKTWAVNQVFKIALKWRRG